MAATSPSAPIVSDQKAKRTLSVEPVTGHAARLLATVQGQTWTGISATVRIGEHVETGEVLDRRGDSEMVVHLQALIRAASVAKRERCYEVHSLLVDEIARVHLLIELDNHEDHHRRATGAQATTGHRALMAAGGGIGLLLGQRERAVATDLELAFPLGDVTAPDSCGAVRPAGEPDLGEGLTTAPCSLDPGHAADPERRFHFYAVVPKGATP